MEQGNFTNMVDELVLDLAPKDPELDEALKWIDSQAKDRGITFYEMVYQVLLTHEANKNAKEWLNNKT